MTTSNCPSIFSRRDQGEREGGWEVFILCICCLYYFYFLRLQCFLTKTYWTFFSCYLYGYVRSSWSFILYLEGWQIKKGRTFELCTQNRLFSFTSCYNLEVCFSGTTLNLKVWFQNLVSYQVLRGIPCIPYSRRHKSYFQIFPWGFDC